MKDPEADTTLTISINMQQMDFVQRMRALHHPQLSIAEMARQALAETDMDEAQNLVRRGNARA